jgi:transposase
VVADGAGTPLAVHVTGGQVHEAAAFEEAVDAVRIVQQVGRPRTRRARLAGDKDYDTPRTRHWLRQRRVEPIIPEKHKPFGRKRGRPPAFDAEACTRRNVVERCVGWLNQARCIAPRFEKTAVNFLATL